MRTDHGRKGPLSAALCKIYGYSNAQSIVRSLASDIFNTARPAGPPYSPFEYARLLGLKIEYAALHAEGVFVDSPMESPRIILRKSNEPFGESQRRRMNFTLAHEIGHFTIRQTVADFVPASTLKLRSACSDEELLCNVFAAELLMPIRQVRDDLSRCELRPESLLLLCEKYDVSLKALLCRARDLFRNAMVAVIWTRIDGIFRVDWATPTSFRQALLCNTGRTTVERALSSSTSESGQDDVIVDGQRMRWPCVSRRLIYGDKVLTVMRRGMLGSRRSTQERSPKLLHSPRIAVQQSLRFGRGISVS
jgi:IrrE N-terminal-like domain